MEEKLCQIYDDFVDQVIYKGWKGKTYGCKETVRSEVAEGGWSHFQLDNGFNVKLTYEGNGQTNATLQYWFDNNPEMVVNVESLEQLLELIN